MRHSFKVVFQKESATMQELKASKPTRRSASTPQTQGLDEPYPHLTESEAEEVFRAAVSELPTQPLIRQKTQEERAAERQVTLLCFLFVASFILGSAIAIVTYPTVTITVTPLSKSVTYTTQLPVPIRNLTPVTLTRTAAANTTGVGHQAATNAYGTLTFYNGQFSAQTLPQGSTVTGASGITVVLDQGVTIPAATTLAVGSATVSAHAVQPGSRGNIQPLAINFAVSSDLFVKNLSAFSGGEDAKTFRAVAQQDLNSLTAMLKASLTQQMPQSFTVRADEALALIHCTFQATPNHTAGEEASMVTVKAAETCNGIAYNQDTLQQQATTTFMNTTKPGTGFQLIGSVKASVINVTLMTVQMRGLWVYILSQDYQAFLATQIAGDTRAQARTYLLKTGFVIRVTVPQNLPKDPQHIKFLQVISD